MDEIIFKIYQLIDKFKTGNIEAFNFTDIIWLIGIAIVIFIIIKISFKLLKFILILVAVALLIGFLITSGIIPIG